jgi:hypothetical protein
LKDIKLIPKEDFGRGFVPKKYLPEGKDEYYLRNQQSAKPQGYWRALRTEEIETLKKNAVACDDWNNVLVRDPFEPGSIRNCSFAGLVRIGRLENVALEHHELQTPSGITNSTVVSCDIGDNCAIHNVGYLAHYIIGDNCILFNVDEMHATDRAKFGNGIVKDGEPEESRVWMDVMNENGGRGVLPFDGMTSADAYLWAKYRDDADLQEYFRHITQRQFDGRRGFYGTVGDGCVIKSTRIVKDVKIGPHCYIKGANKLKNLTINSSEAEPTQIGEGVELVNGIIGFGCRVFYGCKAVRFVLGNNATLKYGARLIHTHLGDNSNVSCCEALNNLIFPGHEQHHNNSFLIASLVMGQSNVAAGATIGSNHNSRACDGEIQAGRGFWPGLSVTLKHNCRFASFVLLAKGDYPAELDIRLPFSLVANDAAADRLLVAPAYWWLSNMYALVRNAWKFQSRDLRKTKTQHVEYDFLAPDTVEEIVRALELLEVWTAQSPADGEVLGENMEHSRREVVIIKAREAYHAYRQMLHYYGVKNLLDYMQSHPKATLGSMNEELSGPPQREWANLGGQLATAADVDRLCSGIKSGEYRDWNEVHKAYDVLWDAYPLQKQRHAYGCLLRALDVEQLTADIWRAALEEAGRIQQQIREQVLLTREKDYKNAFRQTTFRNASEMREVLGSLEDDAIVKLIGEETERFKRAIANSP